MTKPTNIAQRELASVQHEGLALRYVKNQTPEICLAAVQQNGLALHYVEVQTSEVCLAAVQQDGLALASVKIQTPEICLAAVQQDGFALTYIKNPTPEICLAAVQENLNIEHRLSPHNAALLSQARIIAQLETFTDHQTNPAARKRAGINI